MFIITSRNGVRAGLLGSSGPSSEEDAVLGQSQSTAWRALALHRTDLGAVPGILKAPEHHQDWFLSAEPG